MVAFNNMLPMLLLSHNPPHYVCSTTKNQIVPCELIPMHQFIMLQSVEQSGKLNTLSMFLPHYDPLTISCNNDFVILVTYATSLLSSVYNGLNHILILF
jgi:hypothetical protein